MRCRNREQMGVDPGGERTKDPSRGRNRSERYALAILGLGALGLYMLGTQRLATENRRLRRRNDKLELETHTDSLTGLRNRRYFLETVDRDTSLVDRLHVDSPDDVPREGVDYLLLFFDLDDFKEINDRYGHGVGDRVLVQVRWLLENTFRESDDLVRWGGDEFLVVGRHTHRAAAPQIAERLRRQIAGHPFQIGHGETCRVTCSIGFACYPFQPGEPGRLGWRDVLTLADRAQYIAKRSGGNAWAWLQPSEGTALQSADALAARIATDTEGMVRDGWLTVETSAERAALGRFRGV